MPQLGWMFWAYIAIAIAITWFASRYWEQKETFLGTFARYSCLVAIGFFAKAYLVVYFYFAQDMTSVYDYYDLRLVLAAILGAATNIGFLKLFLYLMPTKKTAVQTD